MSYINEEGIREAFAQYLIDKAHYSEREAKVAVSDFPNPYENEYLTEEYIGEIEIEGEMYEQNACKCMLWRLGMKVKDFMFYEYYKMSDIPNKQVGEYMNATKLYSVDDLDKRDFS